MHICKAKTSAFAKILFRTGVLKTSVACRRGLLLETKVPKFPGSWPLPRPLAPSLSGSLFAPLSARRYLKLCFNAPFIVGMRALIQVFEAFRYEASVKRLTSPPALRGRAAPGAGCPMGDMQHKIRCPKLGSGETVLRLWSGVAKRNTVIPGFTARLWRIKKEAFRPLFDYPSIFATSVSISTSSLIIPMSFSHTARFCQLSSFISKNPCSSEDMSGRSISMLMVSTSGFKG